MQHGYLQGPHGDIHVNLFLPPHHAEVCGWVIHAPAFAEEMNKSRAMVAAQSRALANAGMAVLVPDLLGTGDSGGSLDKATCGIWLDELEFLLNWARENGAQRFTLWGHRIGCLLALELVTRRTVDVHQLILWQPVYSGKQHMAQFLRLRMAAGLSGGEKESVTELRNRLLAGETLEIAGYAVSCDLFREFESIDASKFIVAAGTEVRVLEVTADGGRPLTAMTAKFIDKLRQTGLDSAAGTVPGAPFWTTQELSFVPELIFKTTELIHGYDKGDTSESKCVANAKFNRHILLRRAPCGGAKAVVFSCEGEKLAAIIHGTAKSNIAVLIVTGGPQYRVGSHRQFVYLADQIASQGFPVMRFDYRGMGDSSGELLGFEYIDKDIRSAIDALQREMPGITRVVIWGLCDAATAAMKYAPSDDRVSGLILANPWVFSRQGAAKARLKHYYFKRIASRDFWNKVRSGKYSITTSLRSFWESIKSITGLQPVATASLKAGNHGELDARDRDIDVRNGFATDLVKLFSDSLTAYRDHVFFIISGNDLTAAEFMDATKSNRRLRYSMRGNKISLSRFDSMDHTFSRRRWREKIEQFTIDCMRLIE